MTHHHHHHHDLESDLSFEDRMVKLLEHWLKHNTDHAGTYREWAARARNQHLDEVAALIEQAAESTFAINTKFQEALGKLKKDINAG